MTRKFFALLVAVVMLFTCISIASAEEPMKISVAGYMYGPYDAEKDVVIPEIEKILAEKYGINVDIDVVYIEYANYNDIISPWLAAGTAPDVFLNNGETTLQSYYEQGLLKTWDVEFFQENAPTVWNFIKTGCNNGDLADQFDMWLEKACMGGKMVTVPSLKPDGNMPYKTLIYRGDWLDNLSVSRDELPKTVDEYIDLLTRFAKEDPDGNGADDTYGCGLTGMKTLFGAYGMSNGFLGGTSYWYVDGDEVVNPDVSPKSKEVVEILAQMYADGLIDPEFVSGTEAAPGTYWAASNGLITGLYGASANASIDHFRLKEVLNDAGGPVAQTYWQTNGDDAEFVYAPWPAGPDGDYGWSVGYAVAVSESPVYNAKMSDEKLAVIFQILDAFAADDELYMLAQYGIEGEHYTMVDGTPVRNPEMTNEDRNAVGIWGARSLYGADRAFSELAYNLVFYNDASIANRLNYFKLDQYNSYIQDAVSVTLPSASSVQSELNTLRDETYTAMIRGEKSIDEWDAYVEQYMALGGQTLYDEANEWYASK